MGPNAVWTPPKFRRGHGPRGPPAPEPPWSSPTICLHSPAHHSTYEDKLRRPQFRLLWSRPVDCLPHDLRSTDDLSLATFKNRLKTFAISSPDEFLVVNREYARLHYRKRISDGKRMNDLVFTNELNDALLSKDRATF